MQLTTAKNPIKSLLLAVMYGRKTSAAFYGVQMGKESSTWSARHTEVGEFNDRRKFKHKDTPLQQENRLRNMEDFRHRTEMGAGAQFEEELRNEAATGQRALDKDKAGSLPVNGGEQIRREAKAIGLAVDKYQGAHQSRKDLLNQKFKDGFVEFMRGAGKPEEYERANMHSVAAALDRGETPRPITKDPEVIDYLERQMRRVWEYELDKQRRKLRQGRTGPPGRELTLDEGWKLYKHVVHGMSPDERLIEDPNFLIAPPPLYNRTAKFDETVKKMDKINDRSAAGRFLAPPRERDDQRRRSMPVDPPTEPDEADDSNELEQEEAADATLAATGRAGPITPAPGKPRDNRGRYVSPGLGDSPDSTATPEAVTPLTPPAAGTNVGEAPAAQPVSAASQAQADAEAPIVSNKPMPGTPSIPRQEPISASGGGGPAVASPVSSPAASPDLANATVYQPGSPQLSPPPPVLSPEEKAAREKRIRKLRRKSGLYQEEITRLSSPE